MIRRVCIGIFDYVCLGLSILCIAITYLYGASTAIIPTILVDILVLLPTIKKTWINPDSEDAWAWMLTVASQACILISLDHYTLQNTLFWLYVMIMNALVALLIYRRKLYCHTFPHNLVLFYKRIIR
jgi:hypothetical protein